LTRARRDRDKELTLAADTGAGKEQISTSRVSNEVDDERRFCTYLAADHSRGSILRLGDATDAENEQKRVLSLTLFLQILLAPKLVF